MRSLVKKLSSFFYQKSERIETPIWGLIPLNEMDCDEIVQFVDELSAIATALSIEGFKVIYDMSDEPMIEIRGLNM